MQWFERCPERLEAELRALSDAGFEYWEDQAARAAGQIVLTVRCKIDGALHDLRVEFPHAYPFFAFQIIAPTLSLVRHQDPYSKLLCFVRHVETDWNSDDTVAYYLAERLPAILAANKSTTAFDGEAHEGAPVTGYFACFPESVVRYGDWTVPLDRLYGTLELGLDDNNNANEVLRSTVLAVKDNAGKVLGELDPRVQELFGRRVRGRWVRLPSRPATSDHKAFMEDLFKHSPGLRNPLFTADAPDVIGIVFPDEVRYRELQDVWLFLVRRRDRKVHKAKHQRKPPGDKVTLYYAHPDRIGRSDLQARVPRLAPLPGKKAVVIGLGALGSMVSWQLARAGVGRLALWDHDHVSSGAAVRWLLGVFAAGRFKATALERHLHSCYPYLVVEPIGLRIGFATTRPAEAQDAIDRALGGADIIVDCTAEFTVHHYLSTLARERDIPYLWAYGTPGGWGGVVGRAMPASASGCWGCYYRHRTDGTIVAPAQEDVRDIQPVGCFSPTFTGAGFDLDHVSIMAARMAIATLCHGTPDGYGEFGWDVGIVDLWREGRPIAPTWTTYALARHPQCDQHG